MAVLQAITVAAAGFVLAGPRAEATEIRTSPANAVPQCVTPDRLMAFLNANNDRLDPRYKDLAQLYKTHGERWSVRWDYAFFQMLIETGNLTFTGDVRPAQNNFAGLGTTGGGVPGDSYPNISTGVLAQIQHLVAYSGERVPNPVGARTRLKQDDIVAVSEKLRRPVRFADLARRWAVDPKYGRSIEGVADRFRQSYCAGRDAAEATPGAADLTVVSAGASASRSALGGEPALDRAPAAARDFARANRAAAPAANPAVRTVWSRAKDGDVPPQRVARVDKGQPPSWIVPEVVAAPAQAARVEAVVAAGDTARPLQSTIEPIVEPIVKPVIQRIGAPAGGATTSAPAAPTMSMPVVTAMRDAQGAISDGTIALASAAAPFAAAQVVAEAKTAHGSCRIVMASYGGTRTVLIRSASNVAVELIVLSVIPGFEQYMASNYIRIRAPRGVLDGEFANRDLALVRAKEICPEAT